MFGRALGSGKDSTTLFTTCLPLSVAIETVQCGLVSVIVFLLSDSVTPARNSASTFEDFCPITLHNFPSPSQF